MSLWIILIYIYIYVCIYIYIVSKVSPGVIVNVSEWVWIQLRIHKVFGILISAERFGAGARKDIVANFEE